MTVIACFHGLGSAPSSFDAFKKSPALSGYDFVTFTFAGHGMAAQEKFEGDPMVYAAEKCAKAIQSMGKRVFIVGHSMGCAIAMLTASSLPSDAVAGVLIIEGNLVAQDCGIMSRRLSAAQNKDEIAAVKQDLVQWAIASCNPAWAHWAKDVEKLELEDLRDYAASLVRWSESGKLIRILNDLKVPRTYIYGDGYVGHPVLSALDSAVSSLHAPGAGHFVMQDDPEACAKAAREALDSAV